MKKVIDECYGLDELNFTNSKIAMSRVVFECCLKYVVEETKVRVLVLAIEHKDNTDRYLRQLTKEDINEKLANF